MVINGQFIVNNYQLTTLCEPLIFYVYQWTVYSEQLSAYDLMLTFNELLLLIHSLWLTTNLYLINRNLR